MFTPRRNYAFFLFMTLACSPVNAGDRDAQCSFNGGRPIDASVSRDVLTPGTTFTLYWSDGPRMSYRRLSSKNTGHNVSDSKGGRWNASLVRGGFTLRNLDNGNRITCSPAAAFAIFAQ